MDISEGFAATRTTEYRRTETIGIPVPDYHPPHPRPPPPPSPPRRERTGCWYRLCICSVSFFITFSIVYALVWAIVQPKLPEFQIDSVSIPLINTTGSAILPTWEINFHVRNPNKRMKLNYDALDILLYSKGDYSYEYDDFCETQLLPFYQGSKNETDLRASFDYVQQKSVSDMVGIISHGVASLNVDIIGGISPKPNPWMVNLKLKVECIDVKVGFTNSTGLGSLLAGPKSCKAEVFSSSS